VTDALFVYGTLRRGAGAHHLVASDVVRMEAGTLAGHRLVGLGRRYPWCVRATARDQVSGDVLWTRRIDTLLRRLDRYERAIGPDREYERLVVPVEVGGEMVACWTYLGVRFPPGAEPVPGGDWLTSLPNQGAAVPESGSTIAADTSTASKAAPGTDRS
jgi:gamma-glutamylcyclotransferase (GGCT)/AIG2-like uncharacterized protein YtfP